MTGYAPTDHPRRCQKHRSNGQPCHRWAMVGQDCCWTHGGAAPQTRQAAARRLSQLVEPTVEALADALDQGGHVGMRAASIVVSAAIGRWADEYEPAAALEAMTPDEQLDALTEGLAELTGGAIDADVLRTAILAVEADDEPEPLFTPAEQQRMRQLTPGQPAEPQPNDQPPQTTPTGGQPADQPEPNDQPRNRPWSGDPPAIDTSNVDWIFDD